MRPMLSIVEHSCYILNGGYKVIIKRRKVHITEATDSVLVSFRYDTAIVRAMKTVPGRNYNRVTETWCVPKTVPCLRVLSGALRLAGVTGVEAIDKIMMRCTILPVDVWYQPDQQHVG